MELFPIKIISQQKSGKKNGKKAQKLPNFVKGAPGASIARGGVEILDIDIVKIDM